jgi:DTW domain-containing protein YfiP
VPSGDSRRTSPPEKCGPEAPRAGRLRLAKPAVSQAIPLNLVGARPTCRRCLRPLAACWCAALTPLETATRVVFLQHPRESRVAIGTARIAHLGLAGSELHEGVEFSGHARLRELLAMPGTALLFPGPGALAPDALERPPETLLVIDGTWPQARKMIALNPALLTVPRIGFMPRRPGNYRIRREPARHCVATVEAVVEVLAAFERDEARFQPLLRAFESMVDGQLAAAAARTGPPRRRQRRADPWWESPLMPDLDGLWPHLVVIAAEANAHRRGSGVPGDPELLHLAALRPATGEVFQEFLSPRRPLAPGAPDHLEVPREWLLDGRPATDVIQAWRRFCRSEDRLVGWGGFSGELLAQEGWFPEQPPIDLRLVAAHRLKRRPGAAVSAAQAVGAALEDPVPAPGRAGRTLQAVAAFVGKLRDEKRSGRQGPV